MNRTRQELSPQEFLNELMAQTIILQQYKWRNSLPDSRGLKTKKTQEIHKKEKRFVTYIPAPKIVSNSIGF